MFVGNANSKTNVLLYLIATILFIISAITNFWGGNGTIGILSVMGSVVLFRTYLAVKKEYRNSK